LICLACGAEFNVSQFRLSRSVTCPQCSAKHAEVPVQADRKVDWRLLPTFVVWIAFLAFAKDIKAYFIEQLGATWGVALPTIVVAVIAYGLFFRFQNTLPEPEYRLVTKTEGKVARQDVIVIAVISVVLLIVGSVLWQIPTPGR